MNTQGVGKWSFHFIDPDGDGEGAYISFEHPDCADEVLRDGSPLPKRLPFLRHTYGEEEEGVGEGDREGRTFRGTIDFMETYNSTWGGYRSFQCEMTFDVGFNCVLSGEEVWKTEVAGEVGNKGGQEDDTGVKELKQKYGEGSHIYLNSALRERIVGEEECATVTDRLKEEGATDETVQLVRLVMMGKNPLN